MKFLKFMTMLSALSIILFYLLNLKLKKYILSSFTMYYFDKTRPIVIGEKNCKLMSIATAA